MSRRLIIAITCLVVNMFILVNAHATLTNGGFESGLTGWTSSGNGSVQILPSLGSLSPTEGMDFALIGNGPGDVGLDGLTDSGILTSDVFTVGAGGDTLTFDFDFLTEDFTGLSAFPGFEDFFTITVKPTAGADIIVAFEDLTDTSFSLLTGAPIAAPDGTTFFEHLGFQSASVSLAAGTYSLEFLVSDVGDGSFDSGLLIDNVSLIGTSQPIPEPSTILLLGIGIVGLAGTVVRKRFKVLKKQE